MDDIENEFLLHSEYGTIKHVIYCVSNNLFLGRCLTCGKTLTYYQTFFGHNQYCSNNCIDKKHKGLMIKKAFMEKYGVEHISQLERIKEQKKQKSISKYGTENVFQNSEVQQKYKETMMQRYGTEVPLRADEIKGKIRKTNIERYGCEYASQSEDVKKKIVNTNIERYGASNPVQNQKILEKIKSTCIERYGVDNVFKSSKIIRANLDRTYEELKERFKDYVVPMFTKEEYTGHYHDEIYRWKCVKCGNEFESRIYNTSHLKEVAEAIPRCLECYPFVSGYSNEEKEVVEFIKSIYNGEIIENDTSIIFPYEIDILIPDKMIGFEYNGVYWHSEEYMKNNDYHLEKKNKCKKKGICLIHLFNTEWNDKKDIVKDRICSILGVNRNRIYARNCIVKNIKSNVANEFLEKNHLQGGDHSSIQEGLFFNDELVAVMTFGKPRFDRKHDWEMIRFASKLGMNVAGGASKLLAYFRRNHSGSIVSYADRRYSEGNLYGRLGFKLESVSSPNYVWVKNSTVLTRYQCQKHRLVKVLGNGYDKDKTEIENMHDNGWHRVFDCGNLVYVLE